MQVLNFHDSIEFKISKQRFSSHRSASRFCEKQNSKLDVEFQSLLIAMSGAAEIDDFLMKSISFKVKDVSGIWQWSKEIDHVTVMIDGQGVSTEDVSVIDIKKVTKLSLPAICVKKL